MLNTPEASYHGVVYTEAMGAAAYIGRARTVPLRNTGSALSPMNAFLILQGMQTLPLRMERHCENALAVANYLNNHPKVAWVNFAGLPDSPYYNLAQKYTNGKPSALLTFGIKGGFEAGVKFYDTLKLFMRLVNIGDVKSLAAHPASTTHRQLSGDELTSAGVTPDMIRLCVGIEDIEDIIADLDRRWMPPAERNTWPAEPVGAAGSREANPLVLLSRLQFGHPGRYFEQPENLRGGRFLPRHRSCLPAAKHRLSLCRPVQPGAA